MNAISDASAAPATEATVFLDSGQHVTARYSNGGTIYVTGVKMFGFSLSLLVLPEQARAVAAMLVAMADAQERKAT